MEILHKDWLEIKSDSGFLMFGYDQNWYSTEYKRKRGCGPTSATMLFTYIMQRDNLQLPFALDSVKDIKKALEFVWQFVTPTPIGLYSLNSYCKGMEKLFRHFKLSYKCLGLDISFLNSKRPSLKETVDFISKGLNSDCPVAFVNLDRGKEVALEGWHWITIVGLKYEENRDKYIATCYDDGNIVSFDVNLWLETTKMGGAFAYLAK